MQVFPGIGVLVGVLSATQAQAVPVVVRQVPLKPTHLSPGSWLIQTEAPLLQAPSVFGLRVTLPGSVPPHLTSHC